LPASANDPASMVAQALNIYGTVTKGNAPGGGGSGGVTVGQGGVNVAGGRLAGRGGNTAGNQSSAAPAAKRDGGSVGSQRPLFSLQQQQ
jgi:hypothetical protein